MTFKNAYLWLLRREYLISERLDCACTVWVDAERRRSGIVFVTDRTCRSLAFTFDCQHWATVQTNLGLRKNSAKSKKPGLSFASRPAGIEPCSFVFWFTCPMKKPIRRTNGIIATHCRVTFFRSSLITQRRKGVFFFVDRKLSYSSLSRYSSVLAANDCRFQVKSFLQRFILFLIGKRQPCPTR